MTFNHGAKFKIIASKSDIAAATGKPANAGIAKGFTVTFEGASNTFVNSKGEDVGMMRPEWMQMISDGIPPATVSAPAMVVNNTYHDGGADRSTAPMMKPTPQTIYGLTPGSRVDIKTRRKELYGAKVITIGSKIICRTFKNGRKMDVTVRPTEIVRVRPSL